MKKPLKNKLKPRARVINLNKRMGVQVNLSAAEVDLVDAGAARAGLCRSAFMRLAAIEKATS